MRALRPRVHKPTISDPSCGSGGLLKDLASLAALALFITVVVWLAGTAGELVAAWRMAP